MSEEYVTSLPDPNQLEQISLNTLVEIYKANYSRETENERKKTLLEFEVANAYHGRWRKERVKK